jgi:hypothetical protein
VATYGDAALRSMGDVDLWLRDTDMPKGVALLEGLGYRRLAENPERPLKLQRLSGGEIQLRHPARSRALVELHWSPFPGWWKRRTARIDEREVWNDTEPVAPGRHARQPSAEDTVVQLAFHLAVNHFSTAALRTLIDIALTARTRVVDWQRLADRALDYRLATVVYSTLDLADRLVGVPGCAEALSRLRPGPRGLLLRRLVSDEAVLSGRDWSRDRARYLLLLLAADRLRDMIRLAGRTLWPERSWLEARYARPSARVRHLWLLLRRREV